MWVTHRPDTKYVVYMMLLDKRYSDSGTLMCDILICTSRVAKRAL